MKKALNFDLNTNKYEQITGKTSPTAYYEIRHFLEAHGFEHRQGSGYISKKSMNDFKVDTIITEMSLSISWLKDCIRQFDVTSVGKYHSVLDTIASAQEAFETPETDKDISSSFADFEYDL